jgi:hypothetical protein
MAVTTAEVQQLYVAFLGRAADKAGLDYWMGELNATPATMTLENLRANFVNEQAEYAQNYAGLTREETVNKMYSNLFGHAPDTAGMAYWTTGGGASVNADQLLVALVNGALNSDAQILANKVLVADVYTKVAAEQYTQADAKSILSGVTDNYATISTALGHLTDGTLSGIAVPAAVAEIQALQNAVAALDGFETSKYADLKALDKAFHDLSVADSVIADKAVADYTVNDTYAELNTIVSANLNAARATDLGGKSTADLSAAATTAAATASTDYSAFLTKVPDAATLAADYRAADTKFDAVALVGTALPADVTAAQTQLDQWAAVSANKTAWDGALTAAGLAAGTTAAGITTALTSINTTDSTYNKIVSAFSGISAAADLLKLDAQDRTYNLASDAFTKAETAVKASAEGTTWVASYEAAQTATTQLNASKALDTLAAQYKAVDDAHTALTTSETDASNAVAVDSSIVDVTGASVGTASKGEVFYFSDGVKAADATSITMEKTDTLYLGSDYTFNHGELSSGNNNALEFFLVNKADGSGTQLVIETAAYGSNNGATVNATTGVVTDATADDQLAIITLTGVSADQVHFANGVLTVA